MFRDHAKAFGTCSEVADSEACGGDALPPVAVAVAGMRKTAVECWSESETVQRKTFVAGNDMELVLAAYVVRVL